jgi:hypothetical protein
MRLNRVGSPVVSAMTQTPASRPQRARDDAADVLFADFDRCGFVLRLRAC